MISKVDKSVSCASNWVDSHIYFTEEVIGVSGVSCLSVVYNKISVEVLFEVCEVITVIVKSHCNIKVGEI